MQPFFELKLIEFGKFDGLEGQCPNSYTRPQEFFNRNYHSWQFYTPNPCYEEKEGLGLKKAAHLSQANSFEQHYILQILFYQQVFQNNYSYQFFFGIHGFYIKETSFAG